MRAALVVRPAPGESFASWVDRSALLLEVSRREMWRECGLLSDGATQPDAYGIEVTGPQRERIADRWGIAGSRLDVMLLRRFDGTCLNFDSFDLEDSQPKNSWSRSTWAYVWQTNACPGCLRDEPLVWHVTWKVPWSITCRRHRSYLIHHCPGCGQYLQHVRHDERQAFQCCSASAELVAHRRTYGVTARRTAETTCGTVIADVATLPVNDPVLAEIQELIDTHLNPAGEAAHATAGEFFARLKACTVLALYLGEVQLLEGADPAVLDRFIRHVAEREKPGPRKGTDDRRYRMFATQVPTDPLLIAAAVRIAFPLVADDPGEACERFVAVSWWRPDAQDRWAQFEKFWQPPDHLAAGLRQLRDRRRSRFALSMTAARPAATPLSWRHVPQLFWEEHTEFAAGEILAGGWRDHTRRFLSISMARMLSPELDTFDKAAAALEFPKTVVAQSYRLSSRLGQTGEGRAFLERLRTVADRIAQAGLVDYEERRDLLRDFTEIPDTDWFDICNKSGVETMDSYWWSRKREAAIWVWATATGGDFHFAPALDLDSLAGQAKRNALHRYRAYFHDKALPVIGTELSYYLSRLIS